MTHFAPIEIEQHSDGCMVTVGHDSAIVPHGGPPDRIRLEILGDGGDIVFLEPETAGRVIHALQAALDALPQPVPDTWGP